VTQAIPKTDLTEAEQQYPLPPSELDVAVYRDPALYAREVTEIFHQAWFPACPTSDLGQPGDYLTWDQLGQSVVITRRPDLSIAAWHNVCAHRGARILSGAGHCRTAKFKCPWHGFVYDLDGAVVNVPLRDSFDEGALEGLRAAPVRVQEWGGWVWLTLSATAPDLLPYLGVIGEELAGYGLDSFRTVFRTEVTLRANWKIVVDSFNETWHVPFTHQDTLSGMVMWRDAALKITPPHSWMTIPIRGFTDRAEAGDHRQTHLCHYLAFPNTIFSCFPTHLQMWSAWPISVDETVLCAYQMAGPTPAGLSDEKWLQRNERDWQQFLEVLTEDSAVINNFADITRSLGYKRNLFNTAESRLTAFHQEVAKRAGTPRA
jgi:choline monooxygenase